MEQSATIQTIDPNWVNISSKAEIITPSIAVDYLSRNSGNRPLTKNQVKYYARIMREGKWKINGEAICFDSTGKLVNGQHRLSAIIEAQVPIASVVTRGIDPEAFATYDQGMNRSIGQIFAIKGIPNACNVSSIVNAYITLSSTNISIGSNVDMSCAKHSGDTRRTKQEILEVYFSNPDKFQEVYRFASVCYDRLRVLGIKNIGGYCYYLIKDKKHSDEIVFDFFNQLTSETSFDNSMIAALRSKLIKNQMNNPNMRMTSVYIQQLIIKVWNAYISGRTIKCLKWDENVEGKLQFK